MIKTYNKRPIYLEKIKPFINKDIVKVLIGQRRVGKSYILLQIIDELKDNYGVKEEQIIYINKEDLKWSFIKNYEDLNEAVKNFKYIFVDEIQDIEDWEKSVRSLQSAQKYDIYITGSNSNLLSGEFATFLTGRYIEFEIFPLNYIEFLNFHKLQKGKESFIKYITFGGLPYLKHLNLQEEIVYDYVKSVYNTILLKDIVKRYSIRNVDFLDKLIVFLADNIGNPFTANNISKYLKSQNIKIGPNVVLDYIKYTSNTFLLNKVKRQEVNGKKIFEINEKYYFSDLGIRNSLLGGYKQLDIGKILENVIFLHFKSLGYQIYIGKDENREIDFVLEKGNDRKYIQVCYLLSDQKTIDREFGNLSKINDNYEKIVLSLDEFVGNDYKGIKHFNLIEYIAKNTLIMET